MERQRTAIKEPQIPMRGRVIIYEIVHAFDIYQHLVKRANRANAI
jgi:hypothetical protein